MSFLKKVFNIKSQKPSHDNSLTPENEQQLKPNENHVTDKISSAISKINELSQGELVTAAGELVGPALYTLQSFASTVPFAGAIFSVTYACYKNVKAMGDNRKYFEELLVEVDDVVIFMKSSTEMLSKLTKSNQEIDQRIIEKIDKLKQAVEGVNHLIVDFSNDKDQSGSKYLQKLGEKFVLTDYCNNKISDAMRNIQNSKSDISYLMTVIFYNDILQLKEMIRNSIRKSSLMVKIKDKLRSPFHHFDDDIENHLKRFQVKY
jgi:hypothetical protein